MPVFYVGSGKCSGKSQKTAIKNPQIHQNLGKNNMAQKEGFEPSKRF